MEILNTVSPTGREQIKIENAKTDKFGNLTKGEGKTLFVCGIDEPGVMVTTTGDKICVVTVGNQKADDLVNKKITFTNNATAIVRCEKKEEIKDTDLTLELLSGQVYTGDFGAISPDAQKSETEIIANNLSYKIGAFILKDMEKGKVLYAREHNFGFKGLRAHLSENNYERVIIISTTEREKIGILAKDNSAVADVNLRDTIKIIAGEMGIPVDVEVSEENLGLSVPQTTGNGAISGGILIPVKNKGKMYESCSIKTAENVKRLLLKIAEKYDSID